MAGVACYNSPGEAFATTVHKIGHLPGHSHWSNVYFRSASEVGSGQAWISLCEKYKFIIDKLFVAFECNEAVAIAFVQGLRHCYVREVYFDFTDRWMKALRHLFLKPPLTVLSCNRIAGEGIVNLFSVLKDDTNVKLESVFLVGASNITDEESNAIANSFACQFRTLHILSLIRIRVKRKHFIKIAKTLQGPETKLQELCLEGAKIGENGAQCLAKGIENPHNLLLKLLLSNNQIGDAGTEVLAQALGNPNCKLQKLELEHNEIGDAGTEHLAKALRSPNCKLQELQLKHNEIGNGGAQHLANSLDGMLKKLDISHNKNVTEDGAIALAQSLQRRHCTLQELILEYCNIGGKGVKHLTIALQNPHCPLVKLTLPVTGDKDVVASAHSLQVCRLQQLTLRASTPELALKEGRKNLLSALDSCYWCPIQTLHVYDDINAFKYELEQTFEDWRSQMFSFMPSCNPRLLMPDSWCPERRMISSQLSFWHPPERLSIEDHNRPFAKTRDSLISRNAAISDGDLLMFAKAKPSTAKIFVCGNNATAKQSIINYISRPSKWYKRNAPVNSYMKLSLTQILIENQHNLFVSDVCQTDDYLPFFSTKPCQSLFLIVCRLPVVAGEPEFDTQLRYWLKSIASSNSYHGPRPKVIICLVFPKHKENLRAITRSRTEYMIEEFQEMIDFGTMKNNNVFAITEGSNHEVKRMKKKMVSLFSELRYEAFTVPKICVDLLNFMAKLWKNHKMLPVLSVENLVSKFQEYQSNNTEVNIRTALQFLHSIGYIVYHPTSQIVILAREVFTFLVRDLVSTGAIFMAKEDIAMRIYEQMHVQLDLAYRILYSLHLEGIIHPINEAWAGNFAKVPKQFLNPMLVATLKNWPKNMEQKHVFWGRRFECVDKMRTILPQQLFRKLQSKQVQLFEKLQVEQETCGLGAEHIYFVENSIQVIVHIGGEKEGWSNKQWIDVMFKISEERRYDYQQDIILAQIFNQIEDICYADYVCPIVQLEEKVIGNDAVENLEFSNANAEPLSAIMTELCMHGGNHLRSWKDGRFSKLKDLLSPLEFKIHLSDLRSQLMEEFSLCTERACSSSSSRRLGVRAIIQKWLCNLIGTDKLEEQMREMNMSLKELKTEVKEGFQKLEMSGDELNSMLTSKLLQMIALVDPPFPRLLYLTDEHGVLQILSSLYQTTSRLHFMCEWQGGAHYIEGDHKGLQLKLTRKWVVRAAPILVPALKLLVLAARVAATGLVLGVCPLPLPSFAGQSMLRGAALPEVLRTFAGGLEAELGTDWHAKPVQALLKEFLEQTFTGKVISLLDFGLYKVHTPSGISYLCLQHSKYYQCTEDQSLHF